MSSKLITSDINNLALLFYQSPYTAFFPYTRKKTGQEISLQASSRWQRKRDGNWKNVYAAFLLKQQQCYTTCC